MSDTRVPLLAPVALAVDLRDEGLTRGQMGTVVEHLADGQDDGLLIEFADESGATIAVVPLASEQLIVLHRRIDAA